MYEETKQAIREAAGGRIGQRIHIAELMNAVDAEDFVEAIDEMEMTGEVVLMPLDFPPEITRQDAIAAEIMGRYRHIAYFA